LVVGGYCYGICYFISLGAWLGIWGFIIGYGKLRGSVWQLVSKLAIFMFWLLELDLFFLGNWFGLWCLEVLEVSPDELVPRGILVPKTIPFTGSRGRSEDGRAVFVSCLVSVWFDFIYFDIWFGLGYIFDLFECLMIVFCLFLFVCYLVGWGWVGV